MVTHAWVGGNGCSMHSAGDTLQTSMRAQGCICQHICNRELCQTHCCLYCWQAMATQ
jgi:hypothetical protein